MCGHERFRRARRESTNIVTYPWDRKAIGSNRVASPSAVRLPEDPRLIKPFAYIRNRYEGIACDAPVSRMEPEWKSLG
jgi:hypothetical protein